MESQTFRHRRKKAFSSRAYLSMEALSGIDDVCDFVLYTGRVSVTRRSRFRYHIQRINLLVYLKFKNMGFIMLFLMLLLPIKDCFKVIDYLLKITLSTGYVISHCSPLSMVAFEGGTVKSIVQKNSIERVRKLIPHLVMEGHEVYGPFPPCELLHPLQNCWLAIDQ